jgi:hypothetical protein
MLEEEISCAISRHEVRLDPSINLFHVELSTGNQLWHETFPDEAFLKAFLRGVTAGCAMAGKRFLPPAEMPGHTISVFVEMEEEEADDGEASF